MDINKLTEDLVKRREELMEVMESRDTHLEKQHQLYGAINEIDMFLQTIRRSENPEQDLKLIKPIDTGSFFK